MRWTGHGHEAIRATHHKTLELTRDDAITQRATCVVAVGASPEPASPMAGPITVTIAAGGSEFCLEAIANPNWDPAGPAVIRRSPLRLPGTLATHASAAASDLPRELVRALADPAAPVEVRLDRVRGRPTVVLFAADPARGADPRLAAELDAADIVVAEDATARSLAGGGTTRFPAGPVTGRVLVVATADLPGRTVPAHDASTETVGLSARLAVAAACPSRARLIFAADDDDVRRVVRTAAATDRVVLRVAAGELGALLELAERERGTGTATVAQEYAPPIPAAPGSVPALASRDDVFCCLHPANAADAINPSVQAALTALLADGVSTRSAARALAEFTGMPRRRAYDTVIAMTNERAKVTDP